MATKKTTAKKQNLKPEITNPETTKSIKPDTARPEIKEEKKKIIEIEAAKMFINGKWYLKGEKVKVTEKEYLQFANAGEIRIV